MGGSFQDFDDQNVRKSRISDIFNSFSRIPRDCFNTVVADKTMIIPIHKFQQICCEVEDLPKLPDNLGKTMLAIFYKRNPKVIEQVKCVVCEGTGIETHEVHNPYIKWVSACRCENGKRFEWMNQKKDGKLEDAIRRQGVRLEGDIYTPKNKQESLSIR